MKTRETSFRLSVFFQVLVGFGLFVWVLIFPHPSYSQSACTPVCPVFPNPDNCFVDTDEKCKKKVMKMVNEEEKCDLWWDMCPWGCHTNVEGKCVKQPTKKTIVSEDCELVCPN
ncbi:MAG: hypothetical protein U1F57_11490 [bacterium]